MTIVNETIRVFKLYARRILVPLGLFTLASVGCGGGGGGDDESSASRCITYAETLCDRLGDCLEETRGEDQCFAEVALFIEDRGDTEAECEQQDLLLSELTCGQLIALANSRIPASGKVPSQIESAINVALEATQ